MKKLFQTLDNICANRYFPLFFVPIAVLFLLLYSFTTSPIFLNDGMDSAVFKSMGLAILQGKIPYLDIFDHKGPVLYFIDAFGQWLIQGRMGIFVLQCVGLMVALFYQYRTARLFTNGMLSFLSVLVSLFVFGAVIQEGNQCEEWMMYTFSVAIYYAANYFVNRSSEAHPLSYSLIYGICFGLSFFIRPNDAVAQLGGIMVGVTLYLIYKRNLKSAVLNALSFVGGFLIIAVPVLAYFAYHHAVADLYYGLIGFNSEYSGGMRELLVSMIHRRKLVLLLLFVALCVGLHNTPHRSFLWVMIPLVLLVTLFFGTRYYRHYYIVLIPIICLFVAVVCTQKNRSILLLIAAIFCLSPTIESQMMKVGRRTLLSNLRVIYHGQQSIADFYAETDKLYSVIPTHERNSVWNYNLRWSGGECTYQSSFSTLWHNQLVQCNLITYGSNEDLQQRDNLAAKQPLWVVMEVDTDQPVDATLLSLYEPIASTDTTICNIELWHRK